MGSDYGRQVPAVDRAVDVVEAIAAAPDGLTPSDLIEAVGGSRSGLFALLNTLSSRGWLERDDTGRARIGGHLSELAARGPDDDHLRIAFEKVVGAIDPPETTALTVATDPPRIIDLHEPRHTVRCAWQLGSLRTSGPDVDLLRGPDARDRSHVDPVAVHHLEDLVEIAAPVCHDGRTPIAAVVTGIPNQRADDDVVAGMATVVRDLARDMSHVLGAHEWRPWGTEEARGAIRPLTTAEVADVVAATGTARLAVVRDDGTPVVVPLWFEWRDDRVLLAAAPGSAWFEHLGPAGAPVSLVIEAAWPDTHRVTVSGTARPITLDDRELLDLLHRLAARNPGSALPPRRERGGAAGWHAVELVPTTIAGRTGLHLGSS